MLTSIVPIAFLALPLSFAQNSTSGNEPAENNEEGSVSATEAKQATSEGASMVNVVVTLKNGTSLSGAVPAETLVAWELGQPISLSLEEGSYPIPGDRIESLATQGQPAPPPPSSSSALYVDAPPAFPEQGAGVHFLIGLGVSDSYLGPYSDLGLHFRSNESNYHVGLASWQYGIDSAVSSAYLGYGHMFRNAVRASFWSNALFEYFELHGGILLGSTDRLGLYARADSYKGSRILGSRSSVFMLASIGHGFFIGVSGGPSEGWH